MINVKIDIVVDGTRNLFAALRGYGQNMAASLAAIGDELVQSTKQRFDASQAPDGSRWAALAFATILKRASRGRNMARGGPHVTKGGAFRARFQRLVAGNAQPLMDTRTHLYNTLTSVVDGNSVIVGVAAPWGAIHQFGGNAGRGRKTYIPARPYLGISLADRAEIVRILTRDVLAVATTSPGVAA